MEAFIRKHHTVVIFPIQKNLMIEHGSMASYKISKISV